MADLEQPESLPLRPASGRPEEGLKQQYSDIRASDNARQQNGNIHNNNAGHSASGDARQYMGDVTNNTTYNYTVRKRKSDDTLREDGRNRAFLSASAEGQTPRVRHLLRLGVDLDFSDDDGFNALHHACLSGFEDVVQVLLDAGVDINAQSLDLGTPLCLSALREREKVVKLLLSSRANPNKAGKWIGSPLHCAAWIGSVAVTDLLLDYGADYGLSSCIQIPYFNFTHVPGFPVVFNAAMKDSDGWNVIWDCLPFHIAVISRREALVDHFLKLGFAVDAECRFWKTAHPATATFEDQPHRHLKQSGCTALMSACSHSHPDIVSRLLDADAVVEKTSSSGWTALHQAARFGTLDHVRSLLGAGALVDSTDADRKTPLFLAAIFGHMSVAQYLLRNGANVSSVDISGSTPCHYAARYKRVDTVKVLLECGADALAKDNSGRTARDYVSNDYLELYEILSEGVAVMSSDKTSGAHDSRASESSSSDTDEDAERTMDPAYTFSVKRPIPSQQPQSAVKAQYTQLPYPRPPQSFNSQPQERAQTPNQLKQPVEKPAKNASVRHTTDSNAGLQAVIENEKKVVACLRERIVGFQTYGRIYAFRNRQLDLVTLQRYEESGLNGDKICKIFKEGTAGTLEYVGITDVLPKPEALLIFIKQDIRLQRRSLSSERYSSDFSKRVLKWERDWYRLSDSDVKGTIEVWANFMAQEPFHKEKRSFIDKRWGFPAYALKDSWVQKLKNRPAVSASETPDDHDARLRRWESLFGQPTD